MSTTVMSACWPIQIPPTQKAVLISLADNANDHGVCWPSLETIQKRTCFGRSTIIEAIKWLEAHGLLAADRSNGRKTTYQIVPNGRVSQLFDANGKPANPSSSQTRPAKRPVQQPNPSSKATSPAAGLNPSSSWTKPVQQLDTNRQEPSRTRPNDAREKATSIATEAGALAAGIIREYGLTCGITSQHPLILEAAAIGVTVEHALALRRKHASKPITYALRAAISQIQEGQDLARAGPDADNPGSHLPAGASHAAHRRSPPESRVARARRLAYEAEQRERATAQHDGDAGAVGADDGDLRRPLG